MCADKKKNGMGRILLLSFGGLMLFGLVGSFSAKGLAETVFVCLLLTGVAASVITQKPPAVRRFLAGRKLGTAICTSLILLGVSSGTLQRGEAEAAKVAAIADAKAAEGRAEQAAAAAKKRADALRADAGNAAGRIAAETKSLVDLMSEAEWDGASAALKSLQATARPYGDVMGNGKSVIDGVPQALTTALAEATAAAKEAAHAEKVREGFAGTLRQLDRGDESKGSKDYVLALATYEDAAKGLEGIPKADRSYMPGHRRALARAGKAVRGVRSRARAQQRKLDREAAKAAKEAEFRASCGPKPYQSEFSGAISQVEVFVERHAHDPDSVEFERCTPLIMTDKCWMTICKFRAKNAFGALRLQHKEFHVSSGSIQMVN